MIASTYYIIDEPKPSPLSQWMVNPFWILLATMLGGVWLGWPWFIVNSFAIGSMRRTKELLAVGLGLAGSCGLTAVGLAALHQGYLDALSLPYAGLVLIGWKLVITYALQLWQSPSFELSIYFRGRSRNGALLAIASLFLRAKILHGLPDFWLLVLS